MSRKSRQGYSIRHLLQLPGAPRSPPAPHTAQAPHAPVPPPPTPAVKTLLRHSLPSPTDQDARDCDDENNDKQIIHLGDFTKLDVTLEQSKTILIQMKQKAINGGDIPPSSEDTREERLLKK